MSKQSSEVQAKSWQPPAVQTASFGFSARPFPEIARKEEGKQASLDLLQKKENQPGGMIDNINRSLASASPPAPLPILGLGGVQAKLTLGTVGDVYEQEADRVARQVVDEIHSSAFRASNTTSEEESIANGGEAGRVQRQITVRAAGDAGGEISSEWEGELVRAKGGGQPMSPTVREPMERAFGADFGGVRVHTGAQADSLARTIQAKAFTTGQDVFFRRGAYEPLSRGGQELIAHELTHVIQQKPTKSSIIQRTNFQEEVEQEFNKQMLQRIDTGDMKFERFAEGTTQGAYLYSRKGSSTQYVLKVAEDSTNVVDNAKRAEKLGITTPKIYLIKDPDIVKYIMSYIVPTAQNASHNKAIEVQEYVKTQKVIGSNGQEILTGKNIKKREVWEKIGKIAMFDFYTSVNDRMYEEKHDWKRVGIPEENKKNLLLKTHGTTIDDVIAIDLGDKKFDVGKEVPAEITEVIANPHLFFEKNITKNIYNLFEKSVEGEEIEITKRILRGQILEVERVWNPKIKTAEIVLFYDEWMLQGQTVILSKYNDLINGINVDAENRKKKAVRVFGERKQEAEEVLAVLKGMQEVISEKVAEVDGIEEFLVLDEGKLEKAEEQFKRDMLTYFNYRDTWIERIVKYVLPTIKKPALKRKCCGLF
ncbi:DUF4157 domain-containing protein [Nostoc sp. LPT]|uniref:eCIS core domain-containing protein n=1 Tax=Nostoc sp. LPT TaxID=2815387 RepID=UPI001E0A9F76|nr:DUF4157 domain-containing protein [Nostoc sp. LPT]MBN4003326.1 DUF4157 domain-containing protein [Nostoc sp. LPT]